MEQLELYAYTTEEYKKNGWVKVGHTKVGEDRIWNQFGTSNPENPDYQMIGILPNGVRDHHIHAQLIKNGCKKIENVPGQEWFQVTNKNDPFKDVRRAYNEIVNGSSRTEYYKLRKEQAGAIEKASKWFNKEYPAEVIGSATHPHRFLINAKMRFGKCFTSIRLAKKINARNTLIVTYKPDVIGEWIDTVNEQVDFDGWTGIRAKEKIDRPNDPCLKSNGDFPKSTGPIVLCVSLQDLWIDKDGNTKERLRKIPEIAWDLVIFDEVHYGSRTKRAKSILEQIKFTHRLDLSGTPFRLIEQDDFSSQQVYTYSYLDEQKNKKEEIESDPQNQAEKIYRLMPDLNISAIEITDEDIAEQRETFKTDDIDFSLNRLFETNEENKFVYEDAVDHFIEGLHKEGHDARSISVYGKLAAQLGCPAKRHTVWWMNRVDSISALIEKLEKHPHFSKFKLINASGSDKKQDDDDHTIAREKTSLQKAINDSNEDPNKLGTITFTCGRFLTGVTIREWDSILILNDIKSAESYYQAIFRVQSAWVDEKSKTPFKPKAWVFDFAITRCLQVTYDCASNIADQIDQHESYEQLTDINKDNLEIVTEGLCDALDIKRFYEGSLASTPTTAKDIFEVLNHGGSRIALARRITSNVLVNFGKLKLLEENPQLLAILMKVKGYRSGEFTATIEDLVQIGRDASDLEQVKSDPNLSPEEKSKIIEDFTEKDKDKDRQTKKKWYATQIKRLAICMADFIYMTYQREYNIDDVIQTKSPHFFEVMTGISKDDFTELCNKGFMNRFALNRIVREFRDQESTSLNPEQYILENLKKVVSE
ncbi:DEAD/DEAH box helicase family protein [Bdellovibrio sp.]|uniref:DEAD/DEAH box helicase family protein n=1 Tax=Bdellovibrio sp. TaxID=28201 RepID=UPI0039E4B880